MNLELQRRAQVRQTDTARIRSWRVVGAPLRLCEIRSLLGLPGYFLAVRDLPNGNQHIVSRHRKRKPAVVALAREVRHG